MTLQLPSDTYFELATVAREILDLPRDQITGQDRATYGEAIDGIDSIAGAIRDGKRTAESSFMNRLIASGQIHTRERAAHFEALEQQLINGKPVLLADGVAWSLGILVSDELYFSGVNRGSVFGPAADGIQSLLVASHIEIGYRRSGEDSVANTAKFYFRELGDSPPEAGSGVGILFSDLNRARFGNYETGAIPETAIAAWQAYNETHNIGDEGRTRYPWLQMLIVGHDEVEDALGMTLEQVVDIAPDQNLFDYLTR